MTFVEFCRRLGVRLTRGQRVLVLVAYDGAEPRDLTGADRDVARQLFGDIDVVPPEARAVLVAVCGARGGKSYVLGALYSLWRALVADLSTLAAGELAVALIVAPDLRLARQGLRYALGAAKASPVIAPLVSAESSDGFVLTRPDGRSVSIEVLPATRGGSAVRGRTLVCAVLDESAFFRDEAYAVNDSEVFRAVAPRVVTGGMVVVCSTPWAERGLLFDEFTRNHGHPVTALAAHAPTTLLRDDLRTKALVLRERVRDAENAEREFDAKFMGAGGGLFFDGGTLRASIEPTLFERVSCPQRSTAYAGADLGLVRDCSALTIVHRADIGAPYEIVESLELQPNKGSPLNIALVVREFTAVAARHGVREIVADHHLLTIANTVIPSGVDVRFVQAPGGQAGKVESHTRVRDLLRAGVVKMPPSMQRLREQLSQITSTPVSGGGVQIRSPRRGGNHGDLASAAVLALFAATGAAWIPIDWDELAREQARIPRAMDWNSSDGATDFVMNSLDAEDNRRARESERLVW